MDAEVNSLEQACASEKAANLLEAEELKLAHEKLLLDGPDQLRDIQAHTLRISRAQQLLATLKVRDPMCFAWCERSDQSGTTGNASTQDHE